MIWLRRRVRFMVCVRSRVRVKFMVKVIVMVTVMFWVKDLGKG